MKNTLLFLMILPFAFLSCKKDDPGIDPEPPKETVVTDTSMVTIATGFEELLINAKIIPDLTPNGKVKYGDIKDIDTIRIGSAKYDHSKFTSIKGIEYFPNLRYLDMSASYVDSIDLSKNTKLEYLNFSGLSGGGGLLATVKYVNLVNCKSLKYLYGFYNKLTTLDISQNTQLIELSCFANELKQLDISHNPSLKILNTSYNNGIVALDLSKATGLRELRCADNTLATLDVSMLPELLALDCSYNFDETRKTFQSLDLSKNTKLTSLDISGSGLTTLDISKNVNLQDLAVTSTKLQAIDLKGLKELKSFGCSYSDILTLDVTANTKLETLAIGGSKLSEIDLSKNVNLKYLECYFQEFLTSLDLRNNVNLEYFYGTGATSLKTICVSKLPNLTDGKWLVDEATQVLICK